MMLLKLVALLIIGLTCVSGECRRHHAACLDYSVLKTHEGYEERVYGSTVWVTVTAQGARKLDVTTPLIMQLYDYLGGANDRGERLQMAVPVRTKKVVNGQTNIYTMAIPILGEKSYKPPIPTNPNVTVIREPKTEYVVRAFGNRVQFDDEWDHHADLLKQATSNDGTIDTSFYYINVYDSPWLLHGRLNEVWMVKREKIEEN